MNKKLTLLALATLFIGSAVEALPFRKKTRMEIIYLKSRDISQSKYTLAAGSMLFGAAMVMVFQKYQSGMYLAPKIAAFPQ